MKHLAIFLLLLTCLLPSSLQAATLPPVDEIQQKAKQFYDEKGEWAGAFVIQRFMRQRIADQSDNSFTAHLEYEWAFKQDVSRSGTDERTFTFEFRDGHWQVTDMGGNHSGKL